MSPRMSEETKYSIVLVLIFVVAIVWTIFYLVGPCSALERLPLKDAPQRCLR